MKPVDQTRRNDYNGNCWAAAIASILEVPLEEVDIDLAACDPDTFEERWWVEMNTHLIRRHGVILVAYSALEYPAPKGYAVGIGPSKSLPNVGHAVVVLNGKMVHDPSPARLGVDKFEAWEVIVEVGSKDQPNPYVTKWSIDDDG